MFALRTLRELKLLIYLSEEGVSENASHPEFHGPCYGRAYLTLPVKIISILDIIKFVLRRRKITYDLYAFYFADPPASILSKRFTVESLIVLNISIVS